MTVCGTMNCVILLSKYIDSISVLYLSSFICYKLLQLLKYAHIFSVYTEIRLFKSQKTRDDRAKVLINLNSAHPYWKKTPISILASDQKFIFVNQCFLHMFFVYIRIFLMHMLILSPNVVLDFLPAKIKIR